MAENFYEGMFILDSNRYSRESQNVASQVNQMIEAAGGHMMVSRVWEERRLAYPIQGHRKGTYWLTYFRLEGAKLTELERACQLNDNVLRVLFLRVDARIIDALVAHAQTGQVASSGLGAASGEDAGESSGDEEKVGAGSSEEKTNEG